MKYGAMKDGSYKMAYKDKSDMAYSGKGKKAKGKMSYGKDAKYAKDTNVVTSRAKTFG